MGSRRSANNPVLWRSPSTHTHSNRSTAGNNMGNRGSTGNPNSKDNPSPTQGTRRKRDRKNDHGPENPQKTPRETHAPRKSPNHTHPQSTHRPYRHTRYP